MYFHVIFWRCQKDDRGKNAGGEGGREKGGGGGEWGGHEQEAMADHLRQSRMETAIVNSYVHVHGAAGHLAPRHKNLD